MLVADNPQFAELLRSEKRIVFLCGTGFSMSLGCHGLSWSRWLSEGCNYLNDIKVSQLTDLLTDTTPTGLIRAASFCLSSLKSAGTYTDFMDSTVGSLKPQSRILSSAITSIARSGDVFATTNYDMLIEKATGQKSVTYNSPASILGILNREEQTRVIHIHGVYDNLSNTDDIIADDTQYAEIIENQAAQFIQNLISTYPLVIVGCGATVDDPNLKGFLSFAAEELGLNVSYYYLHCGETPPADLSGNMTPVCYGEHYDALPGAVTDIAQYRLKHRFRNRALIRVNPYITVNSDSSAYSRLHYTSRFMKFVGRNLELSKLNSFLGNEHQFSWWAVIGPGGIGKSRLILEWLKQLPGDWFGFISNTLNKIEAYGQFIPFSNTVIVFDYVNGNAGNCARIISELYSVFDESIYKIRILFLERDYLEAKDNWLDTIVKQLDPPVRMVFSIYSYQRTDKAMLVPLMFSPMSVSDEKIYAMYYLDAYLSSDIGALLRARYSGKFSDLADRIVDDFHRDFPEEYRRPLFLSIYSEVWISKDGGLGIHTVRDLLSVFMEKEENQWLTRFHNDKQLLKSYQKLLALASATYMVCLIDPAGFLQSDADALLHFVSDECRLGGKGSSFADLFIYQELAYNNDDKSEMLEVDYTDKVYDEVRLEDEIEHTQDDPNQLRHNEKGEPILITILEPLYPDIIRAFIVDYYIPKADWISFTELARDQTTMEFSLFLIHAMKDFPDTDCFKKMAFLPPKDTDRFGYYITLLSSLRVVDNLCQAVDVLMASPVSDDFGIWESEIWRRIAIVLTEQNELDELYRTGCQYFDFVGKRLNNQTILDAVPDVVEAFFVGLHNAERVNEFANLAERLTKITESNSQDGFLATSCIEAYQKLAIHYARANDLKGVRGSWKIMMLFTHRFPGDVDNGRIVSEIAEQLCDWYSDRGAIGRVALIINEIRTIYAECKTIEIAEVLAVLEANAYFRYKKSEEDSINIEDKMMSSKSCVSLLYETYPESERVILAYSSILADSFMDQADFQSPVTIEDCERFKDWKSKCSNYKLEMSEHYCRVLFARCSYLRGIGEESKARSIISEMRGIGRELSRCFGENDVADMVEFMEANWMLI